MAFKVLLVEDDNNLREIYEARLQAEGYNIVTARDGEEALGVAKAEVPDLVISDVMMPRVSGFEMLDILRNTDTLRDVKVIMLTALGQADDKTRANSLGADRYLVKSQVTLEDIVKTAHELLGDNTSATAPAPSMLPAAPSTGPSPAGMPSPAITPAPIPSVAPSSTFPAPAFIPVAAVSAPPLATPPAAPTFSPTANVSQLTAVPEPPRAAPAPVTPTPSLPPMPGTTPAPAPMVAPMSTTLPMSAAAPSTSEEKATIDTQIDNFVHDMPDNTPAVDPNSTSTQDDAVLADAMHDLAANTKSDSSGENGAVSSANPEPGSMPVASAPTVPALTPQLPAAPLPVASPPLPAMPALTPPAAPETPARSEDKPQPGGNSVIIANKKIIQPLSSAESKPSIHELAAREEANATPAPGVTPPATTFSPSMPTPPLPPAGPVVGGPGVVPAPQAPPANSGGFDPNSISL